MVKERNSIKHTLCRMFKTIRFQYFLKFKVGLGGSTNNKVVLIALKHILMSVVQKGVQQLQVMGDSMVVINWLRGLCAMEIFLLRPIYEKIIF